MLQALVYWKRILLRNAGTTILIVLTLSLGIGATAAIFSVVNSVLLRPLPFKDPDRIVGLRETLPDEGSLPASYRAFAEWRDRNTVFESIAGAYEVYFNFETTNPIRVTGACVSASYFSVMGVQPILGRTFSAEETIPGAPRVAILGYELWQTQFGGDANVIGKNIRLSGNDYTVVGVMRPGLDLSEIGWASLWAPMVRDDQKARGNPGRYLKVNARLKAGVSVDQARRNLEGIMNIIRQDFPETHGKPYGADIRSLRDFVVSRDTQRALMVLLGVVAGVLLIACANVANLMLVRAASRERELAVRSALGASRWQVTRQLLMESLLLSLIGAAGGLLLAKLGIKVLLALQPEAVPRLETVAINKTVLAFTIGVTAIVAMAVGLAPAIMATKLDANALLKEGGRGVGTGRRHNRLRSLLVVSEIALALILLIGSGLMIRTYFKLRAIELGFNPDSILTMQIILPTKRYEQGSKKVIFYRELLERVKAIPGVSRVSAAQTPPLGPTVIDPVYFEGRPVPPVGQEPYVRLTAVTADFFQVVGNPLIKGRPFTDQETWETGGVVIVNEAFVQRFFPDSEPLGKRFKIRPDQPWQTIVGVSKNVLQDISSSSTIEEAFRPYMDPTDPFTLSGMRLAVRTNVEPKSLVSNVREEVRKLDPELPVAQIMTMQEMVDRVTGAPRFNMFLFSLFGAVALILAAVGIYGVMSQAVNQQTHQIGIRMALGAKPIDVMRLVLGKGMLLTIAGLLIGLAGGFMLTRLVESLLYDVVRGTDLITFIGFPAILVGTAFLACYIPARRAVRIEPMNALRSE
jgi:putative ABC transport system permease protein